MTHMFMKALTDEVYESYLLICERNQRMGEANIIIPAKSGFQFLYDDFYKENFGHKN